MIVLRLLRAAAGWFLVVLATMHGHAVAATATVALKAQAEVEGRVFRLGEVAEISCSDAELARMMAAAEVGRMAMIGRPAQFHREELQRYLAHRLPEGLEQLSWTGAQLVSVQMKTVRLEPELVLERAAADLRAHLQDAYAGVEVRPTSRVDALRLPAGELTFRTRLPRGDLQSASSRVRVEVDVLVSGETVRTLPLWFDVRVQEPESGSSTWVSPGDEVAVEVRAGAVMVESTGTALASGGMGQQVQVRIPGATTVRGRVVGPKRLAL